MKKKVSGQIVAHALGPLCSPPDDEWLELARVDTNDPCELKELLCSRVLPAFNEFDFQSRDIIKNSLSYFIRFGDIKLERLFASYQIPLNVPKDSNAFLKIMWMCFFKGEELDETPPCDYVVDDSEASVQRLYKLGYRREWEA